MAIGSGSSTVIKIAPFGTALGSATDITDLVLKQSTEKGYNSLNITTMGSTAEKFAAGLRTGKASLNGLDDQSRLYPIEVAADALAFPDTGKVTLWVYPQGATGGTTDPLETFAAILNVSRERNVGEVATFSYDFTVTGGVTYGLNG